MPRRNRPRNIRAERYLAQRIASERERRGWTYEELAARMTAAGCPLNKTAIYKIERENPPRRIVVDELVSYAQVFGIPVEQMLLDPDLVAEQRLIQLLDEWTRLTSEYQQAFRTFTERLESVQREATALVVQSKQAEQALGDYFKDWAVDQSHLFSPGRRPYNLGGE